MALVRADKAFRKLSGEHLDGAGARLAIREAANICGGYAPPKYDVLLEVISELAEQLSSRQESLLDHARDEWERGNDSAVSSMEGDLVEALRRALPGRNIPEIWEDALTLVEESLGRLMELETAPTVPTPYAGPRPERWTRILSSSPVSSADTAHADSTAPSGLSNEDEPVGGDSGPRDTWR